MVQIIELNGREFPFKLTLGAMSKFDNKFKSENISILNLSDVSKLRIEHMTHLMFYGIEGGYKFEGEKCPIKIDWVQDNVGLDGVEIITKALGGDGDVEEKKSSEKKD